MRKNIGEKKGRGGEKLRRTVGKDKDGETNRGERVNWDERQTTGENDKWEEKHCKKNLEKIRKRLMRRTI